MGRYRRTVSFPNPISSFTPNCNPNRNSKSYHVRSVSLPCGRTHPLIPQLQDQITQLRSFSWAGSAQTISGLARLKSVLDSLDDVLQLPQTQDSLHNDVVERLLEDFLKFVDVYEVFHVALLGLRQEVSAAQVAIRRKDDSKLGVYVKAHKKFSADVAKLISAVGSISDAVEPPCVDIMDEVSGVVREVRRLTASVSESVFAGVSGSFGPGRRPGWAGGLRLKRGKEGLGVEEFGKVLSGVESLQVELLKKKKSNNNDSREEVNKGSVLLMKGMQEMEECVGEMERQSEKVFRSLISNRVSLLNILTHA